MSTLITTPPSRYSNRTYIPGTTYLPLPPAFFQEKKIHWLLSTIATWCKWKPHDWIMWKSLHVINNLYQLLMINIVRSDRLFYPIHRLLFSLMKLKHLSIETSQHQLYLHDFSTLPTWFLMFYYEFTMPEILLTWH